MCKYCDFSKNNSSFLFSEPIIAGFLNAGFYIIYWTNYKTFHIRYTNEELGDTSDEIEFCPKCGRKLSF